MSRALFLLGASVLLVILTSQLAFSLKPDRALTQYTQRIWQMQQGLPDATIYAIWQTHDGYLWLGTEHGLVRFDGIRFTSVTDGTGLPLQDIPVRNLLEDDQHNLWIGTENAGLLRLPDGQTKHYSQTAGLPADSIRCLVPDRSGDFWVCTAGGLARVSQDKILVYRQKQGLSTNNLVGACEDKNGVLWAGGENAELSRWNGTGFIRYALPAAPKHAAVRAMLCSQDGTVWVGTTEGLVQVKEGAQRLFTIADGLADNRILSLAESRAGMLFIGTKNGFSRLMNGKVESFRTQDGLSQSTVYSFLEDREGSLWVGTKHGLNQFLDRRALPFTVSEGLPSNDTGPVIQDRNGNVWVGTLGAGLSRYDGRRFSVLTARQGLAGDFVYALADDPSGDLWVGTNGGLNRLRDGRVVATYTVQQGLPGNTIRSLFRDHTGTIWVGTSLGVATVRGGGLTSLAPFGISRPAPVLGFAEDRNRNVVAATEDGGLSFDSNGTPRKFSEDEISLRDVDAFYRDNEGLLWMGTLGGGLRLLKEGKIISFSTRDGLFDDEIYGIVQDDQDRLWMACSKGIFSVSRSDLLMFASGELNKLASTPYIPMVALRTIECRSGVQPALWKTKDGRLWFSTIHGVIVLDPRHMERKLPPPSAVLEEVSVDGETHNPSEIERLSPGRNNLDFRYTGLSFVTPSRITFRYRLEGFDKNWIDAGTRREAFYANLPPGKFVFRVAACSVEGGCNQAGSSITFVLMPRYYQRSWFLPVCAALTALIVWFAHQLRVRLLRRGFDIVLAERTRIARELHDTLIQGFSGVTMELQALCERLSARESKRALSDIIVDAGTCLREARRSVAGLRRVEGSQAGLSDAIIKSAMQIVQAKKIRLKLKLEDCPRDMAPEVEHNLLLIAQEALSNSVKHSGAHEIEIRMNDTEEGLCLKVIDNGAGLSGTNGLPMRLGHFGVIGMRERASQIGADLTIESAPGGGTSVRVFIPRRTRGKEIAFSDPIRAEGKVEAQIR